MNLKDLAENPAVGAGVLGRGPAGTDSEGNEPISQEIAKNPAPTGGSPVGPGLLTRGLEEPSPEEGKR